MRTERLFRKITREGVSANQSRRIKDGWLGLDQREERRKGSGRNSDAGGKLHGRWRGGLWRARNTAYGPRFEEPRTPGVSWGEGELANGRYGGRRREPRRRTPWPAAKARGRSRKGPKRPRNTKLKAQGKGGEHGEAHRDFNRGRTQLGDGVSRGGADSSRRSSFVRRLQPPWRERE